MNTNQEEIEKVERELSQLIKVQLATGEMCVTEEQMVLTKRLENLQRLERLRVGLDEYLGL